MKASVPCITEVNIFHAARKYKDNLISPRHFQWVDLGSEMSRTCQEQYQKERQHETLIKEHKHILMNRMFIK